MADVVSLGAHRDGDASSWSPVEMLLQALNDARAHPPRRAFIILLDDEDCLTFHNAGKGSIFETLGMLEAAKLSLGQPGE